MIGWQPSVQTVSASLGVDQLPLLGFQLSLGLRDGVDGTHSNHQSEAELIIFPNAGMPSLSPCWKIRTANRHRTEHRRRHFNPWLYRYRRAAPSKAAEAR